MDAMKYAQVSIILLVILFASVDFVMVKMIHDIIKLHNATIQILKVKDQLNVKQEIEIHRLDTTLNFFYHLFTDLIEDEHEGSVMYKLATMRAIITITSMKSGFRPYDKDIWNCIKNPKVETIVHNMKVMLDPKKYNGIDVMEPTTKSAYESFMRAVEEFNKDLSIANFDLETAENEAKVAVVETVGPEETDDKFTERLKTFVETKKSQEKQEIIEKVDIGDESVKVLVDPAAIDSDED